MVDLKTSYLGMELKNPIVASSSPFSEKVESAKQLEEAGIAAIVMYSLFEEDVIQDEREFNHFQNLGTDAFPEALSYTPDMGSYLVGPDAYIEQLESLKSAVSIPVIASLNAVSIEGWTEYAKRIEAGGADALELNLYRLSINTESNSSQLELDWCHLLEKVRASITIPIAVKISPWITAIPNFARSLVQSGADGLVLFNRFYQPDFDLDKLEVVHKLSLSSRDELLVPLRWIALLYGRVEVDFSLTGGVHTANDVLKCMMAGANIAMTASSLLINGAAHVTTMLDNLRAWMTDNDYDSIKQMQGSMSSLSLGSTAELERSNYMKSLRSYSNLP